MRQETGDRRQETEDGERVVGEFVCKSPDDTFELGFRFGESFSGGEVVLFYGELGAGKTLFVKGITEALDYDVDEVTSPSFTLVNLYRGKLNIYHIDLYRLNEGASSAHAVDLDDLLMEEDAVILIEWAERLADYKLPSNVFHIRIKGDGDDPRTINIKAAN